MVGPALAQANPHSAARFVRNNKVLREVEGLADLSVFTGFQQATNFPATPAQGEILSRLVGGSPDAEPGAAADRGRM